MTYSVLISSKFFLKSPRLANSTTNIICNEQNQVSGIGCVYVYVDVWLPHISGGGSIFSLVRQIHTLYFHSSFCIKGTMLLKFEFEIIKEN